jgi:hypothetical protein
LNADFSAINNTLPQRGHLGRPKLCVAATSVLQAHWMVIVDSPRRTDTRTPVWPYGRDGAGSLWRGCDAIMKLSWPAMVNFRGCPKGISAKAS